MSTPYAADRIEQSPLLRVPFRGAEGVVSMAPQGGLRLSPADVEVDETGRRTTPERYGDWAADVYLVHPDHYEDKPASASLIWRLISEGCVEHAEILGEIFLVLEHTDTTKPGYRLPVRAAGTFDRPSRPGFRSPD